MLMDDPPVHLFTIGFTEKSAEAFFGLLRDSRVDVLVDTRLKPDSQLSGFAKRRDLPYFLQALVGCDYLHMPLLAPTDDLLNTYRGDKDWAAYEVSFNALLVERGVIWRLDRTWWADHRACLLCSEHRPDHCHRRLVAEYMATHWKDVQISHLL